MPDPHEMTPQDGSLEGATKAITGLLSDPEEKKESKSQPEPLKVQAEPETKQAQPESEKAIEDAKPADEEEPETPVVTEPRRLKVKIDGIEQELPEDEVVNGYSRTADYTRKTQQLAEQRKQFEQNEVAAVRAERQQYQSHLEQLKQAIETIAPKKPDFERLRATMPPEQYAAKVDEWRIHREKVEEIEGTQASLKARQDEDAERGFQQYLQDQHERLEEKLPEIKDAEKGRALRKDLSDFALSKGFSEEELSKVTDHRLVLLLNAAMQGERTKAKAPDVKNKIANAMEPAKPGPSKSTASKVNRFQEANKRLRESGRTEDGAAAIDALLESA